MLVVCLRLSFVSTFEVGPVVSVYWLLVALVTSLNDSGLSSETCSNSNQLFVLKLGNREITLHQGVKYERIRIWCQNLWNMYHLYFPYLLIKIQRPLCIYKIHPQKMRNLCLVLRGYMDMPKYVNILGIFDQFSLPVRLLLAIYASVHLSAHRSK